MAGKRIHLTLSTETQDGRCGTCGADTVLVSAINWVTHPEDDGLQDVVDIADEVTGHVCPECRKLTSLSFNEGA